MSKLASILDKYSRILLLFFIIAGMSLLKPEAFLTYENFSTVIFQQAPFTILMSFGMTLAIITKGIDKSMGSILVLTSVLCAAFIKQEQYIIGIALALALGILCGFLNGILITRVGVAPFIATYGIEYTALGLAFVYTGGQYIYDFPPVFRSIGIGTVFGIPNLALITFLIFIVLYFLTRMTTFGRRMYSAGFNFNATTLSGISAKNTVTLVYIINGLLAAVAGILYMARLNAADPGISGNFTLDSIAATLIGGTSFGGGKGSVAGTVIGSLIIVFIRNSMNIMGVSTTWQQTAVGFIIVFSILLEAATRYISNKAKSLGMVSIDAG
ncbi:MAG: ABC transporter permease [Spirochaetales bacterium]|nr:ABC transporter permease [Spirochaetales bacterium]